MKKLYCALLALPLIAGCSTIDRGAAAPGHRPTLGMSLPEPSAWEFTSINGQNVIGSKNWLNFEQGRISANAGCNNMMGEYRKVARRIEAQRIASTMMLCEQPVMNQERQVAALLEGKPTYTLENNTLRLQSAHNSATLRRVSAR